MAEMANSRIQAIQDQLESPNSLGKVMIDNWVVLGCLLAGQGRVCVIANSSCCVYISNLGKVKKNWRKSMFKWNGHHL